MLICIAAGVLLVSTACSLTAPAEFDPTFDSVPVMGARSPHDVSEWLIANVAYVSDEAAWGLEEYFQSPEQTCTLKTGDCDDFSILMMYDIRREIGGWPEFVYGMYDGNPHCWVAWESRLYETQTGGDVTDDALYSESGRLSYGETMWRSISTHRSVRVNTE